MAIKDVLPQLRRDRGLTQQELAAKLYVTRQAVSRWETGETEPGIDMTKLLADGSRRVLIPHVMDLYLVHNTGAAFSMGEGSGWLFTAIALVVFAIALRFVWASDDITWPLVATVGLVAGGGIGNMIDRLLLGSVTDFLATSFMRFPVFNVADIAVTCGAFLIIILAWRMDARGEE